MKPRLSLAALAACLLLALLASSALAAPEPQDPDDAELETPSQTTIWERLEPPPMPANPSQADRGALVYYQVCMACHGDKGQGLTNEWRAVWEEDSNCWTAKCHGASHPPQGFIFPRLVPAVFGAGTLARFNNAQELYTYTIDKMPWWNPGYLRQEEFWQVTAFMMRGHAALPPGATLDAGSASVYRLHSTAAFPGDHRPALILISTLLAASAGLFLIQDRIRR